MLSNFYQNEMTFEDKLSALIVRCMNSNEKLPTEKEMMEEFSVSRTQLRDALATYEACGLLVSQQGSGRYVRQADMSTQICNMWSLYIKAKPALLVDLLEIRTLLDIAAIPSVLEKITPQQLHELCCHVAEMRYKAKQGKTFASNDRAFHQVMFSSAGNFLLSQLQSGFWDLYEQFSIETYHEGLEEVAEQHAQMLEAVAEKDAAKLEQLMRDQYEDAKQQIMTFLLNIPNEKHGDGTA